MTGYKHYTGITSQIPFCATPLRLDISNKCSFTCGYCFAATRQGHGRKTSRQLINPEALSKRLERVSKGEVHSAVDDFIQRRIPFQLGGMSDPIAQCPDVVDACFNTISALNSYNYPFIFSTKSHLIADEKFLPAISSANTYIRFSITGIEGKSRQYIDKKCPSISKIFRACEKLAKNDIPVAIRLQPIIPGHEEHLPALIDQAYNSGVRHISAEYLKVPIDANKCFSKALFQCLPPKPIDFYIQRKATRQGREYNLPLQYRSPHLLRIRDQVRRRYMTFGFADNDLLLHSDGNACCSAANLYLKDSNFFEANVVGISQKKKIGEKIFFNDFRNVWIPKHKINPYLNSTARTLNSTESTSDWLLHLKEMWLGHKSIFVPSFFNGVGLANELDHNNLPIYIRNHTNFDPQYSPRETDFDDCNYEELKN